MEYYQYLPNNFKEPVFEDSIDKPTEDHDEDH